MKKCVCGVVCLSLLAMGGIVNNAQASLATTGSTNSVTDFVTADNVAAGGRWSCYSYYDNAGTLLQPQWHQTVDGIGTAWDRAYTPGGMNIRAVYNTGRMHADYEPVGVLYTIGANDPKTVDITGSWTPNGAVEWAGIRVAIVKISDGSTSTVNLGTNYTGNVTELWSGTWGADAGWGPEWDASYADTKTFDLTNVPVATGDDIFFTIEWLNASGDGAARNWWWEATANLNATITGQVPEPITLATLAIGAVGLLRRKA